MVKKPTLKFEPSARLQSLLGRELISNEYVAMAEIVRNAYDAGATEITIRLESGDPQKFIITDNGSGMSAEQFKKVWMTPGYSAKAEPGANETLLGEKGIGRFAADKIARRLTVTTKISSRGESLRVNFDWDKFNDQTKKLTDIQIPMQKVLDSELAELGSGTRLELTNLRKQWKKDDWDALRLELMKLVAPNRPDLDFKIFANSSSWASGKLVPLFDEGSAYQFFFSLNKDGRGIWTLTRPNKIIEQLKASGHIAKRRESGEISSDASFGATKGQFYFFDKASQITKQGFESGVAIYRDGFRVEPYGRANDDWIEVKLLKSKRHGKVPITPSRLFGFVDISRAANPGLKDLTNREGIQDSEEFDAFKAFVIEQFLNLAGAVGDDKKNLPESKSISAQRRSTSRETKSDALATLADQLAHQLKQPLTVISTSIETMRLHLIEQNVLDDENEKYLNRVQESISRLNSNITGLASLAKDLKGKPTQFDLVNTVREFVADYTETFSGKGIGLEINLEVESARVNFSKPVLNFVLDNFLTNALKATELAETNEPILVGITQQNGKFRVLVKDFGVAVPEDVKKNLFDEPVSSSDEGWGKGLYYSKIRVEPFNGVLDWYAGNGFKTFFIEIG